MKPLKEFIIKEEFLRKNIGLGKEALIKKWLDECGIINYTINDDFTIDVNGAVVLDEYPDEELPKYIQFNYVKLHFNIQVCEKLKSLRGCPIKCGQSFRCGFCQNLESLEYAPKECKRFECQGCSSLETLEGTPEECVDFTCYHCHGLTSYKGAPKKCENFYGSNCKNLTSLEGAPEECEEFYCAFCDKLASLKGAPKKCKEFHCMGCKGNFTKEDVKKVCNVKKIKC